MSFQITESFVNQYSNNFMILAQQKQSRFEACVDIDSGIVGASKSVERIGSTDAYDITSRHADTKYVDTPHTKRWIDLQDKGWADLVDNKDKIKMLADPTSEYLRAGVMSLNRSKDDFIIAALRGSARTTAAGATTVALPSGQKVAHGSVGLTVAKILTAKQLLDEAEVDEDEARYFAVTAEQLNNMLSITQVTSTDYVSVHNLVSGKVDTFLGFKFIRSERLAKVSTERYCLAWAKTGCRLGIGQDIETRISEMPDKNYSVQVFASMSLGAVRTEEARVVEVSCIETA